MKNIMRFLKHLSATRWQVRRLFPKHSMRVIEEAITASEKLHMGELRFAVEAGLDWPELFAGVNSRTRALQVFSNLGVWDTEHNSGVLIYLLLADHRVEVVADRGINNRVSPSEWVAICQDMESKFRAGEFEKGVLLGIAAITGKLQLHFPAQEHNSDDLPNRPTIL